MTATRTDGRVFFCCANTTLLLKWQMFTHHVVCLLKRFLPVHGTFQHWFVWTFKKHIHILCYHLWCIYHRRLLDLVLPKKNSTYESAYKQSFMGIWDRYSDCISVYKHGSWGGNFVACASFSIRHWIPWDRLIWHPSSLLMCGQSLKA